MRPSTVLFELELIEKETAQIVRYVKEGCFDNALHLLEKTQKRIQRLNDVEEIARKEFQESQEAEEGDG